MKFKLYMALAFVTLVLTGCAPHYTPVRVEVPVAVPCRAPAVNEPTMPPPGETLFDKVKSLLAEIELRKGYEAELRASVDACQ